MKNYIVGVLFFGILVLAFYYTILSKDQIKKTYPYQLKVYFARIDEFKEGTDVSVLGIKSGIIGEIRTVSTKEVRDKKFIDISKPHAVELTLYLNRPLTLWDNYQIKFNNKTSFSNRYLEIDPGHFKNKNSSFYKYPKNQFETDFSLSGEYYDNVFISVTQVLEENRLDLRKILINTKSVTSKLQGTKGDLSLLINSDQMYISLDETFKDLSIIGKEARWYTEGVHKTDTILIPIMIASFCRIQPAACIYWFFTKGLK